MDCLDTTVADLRMESGRRKPAFNHGTTSRHPAIKQASNNNCVEKDCPSLARPEAGRLELRPIFVLYVTTWPQYP